MYCLNNKTGTKICSFVTMILLLLSILTLAWSNVLVGELHDEGNLWWDCQTSFCSIDSLDPEDCSVTSTTLPLGHYYWKGIVRSYGCINGVWTEICSTPSWYFNYNPIRQGGSVSAGETCDECPNDPNKTEPGKCGCGVADTDIDGDGTPDCTDNCPNDPNKTEPRMCGCGVADTDVDGDGTPDCTDNCPNDPNKTEPRMCGCGVADTDVDGDGTPDCTDNCPNDPNKTEPRICGCGVADTDVDGDGTPDCTDNCPNNPDKTEPGICGCDVPDTDSKGDGTPDCIDDNKNSGSKPPSCE